MRMHPLLAALLAAGASMGLDHAPAATVSTFYGDDVFNDMCQDGVLDGIDRPGLNNQACEFAVGEIRSGNGAVGGDWEVGIQNPPGTGDDVKGFAHPNGDPVLFEFAYDGEDGLSLTYGSVTSQATLEKAPNLDGMTTLFIRTRGADNDASKPGFARLDGLMLYDGNDLLTASTVLDLGSNVPLDGGWRGAAYIMIDGFDFGSAWTLVGSSTFGWTDRYPNGSRLDHNFKLTDYAAPQVPLPAAGWMLLAGIGALAGARGLRRR